MNTDNKTKAIVSDMLGVTQGSDAVQSAIQTAAQAAASVQETNQETKQTQENFFLKEFFADVNVTTDVSVQNVEQISNLSNYSDNLQDNSIRNQSIQNYISTLSEKMNSEQEYIENIK
jgi:hypothetical protein